MSSDIAPLIDPESGPREGGSEDCAWLVLSAVLDAAERWPLRAALSLTFAEDQVPEGSALRFAWGAPAGVAESERTAASPAEHAGAGVVLPWGFALLPEGKAQWDAGFAGVAASLLDAAARQFAAQCALAAPPEEQALAPLPCAEAFALAAARLGEPPDLVLARESTVEAGGLDQALLARHGARLLSVREALPPGLAVFVCEGRGLGEAAVGMPAFRWRNDALRGYHVGEVEARVGVTLARPARVCCVRLQEEEDAHVL